MPDTATVAIRVCLIDLPYSVDDAIEKVRAALSLSSQNTHAKAALHELLDGLRPKDVSVSFVSY